MAENSKDEAGVDENKSRTQQDVGQQKIGAGLQYPTTIDQGQGTENLNKELYPGPQPQEGRQSQGESDLGGGSMENVSKD